MTSSYYTYVVKCPDAIIYNMFYCDITKTNNLFVFYINELHLRAAYSRVAPGSKVPR